MDEKPTLSERLVARAPEALVQQPERLFLNFLFVIVGVLAFFIRPGSLLALWPRWVAYEWAAVMLVGGALGFYGLVRSKSYYRIGHLLAGTACLVYGSAILIVFGTRGIGSGVIFVGLGLMKFWRLIVDSSTRNKFIRRGAPFGSGNGGDQ